jgi:hypothetical protein
MNLNNQSNQIIKKKLNVDINYGLVDDCLVGHVHFYDNGHVDELL